MYEQLVVVLEPAGSQRRYGLELLADVRVEERMDVRGVEAVGRAERWLPVTCDVGCDSPGPSIILSILYLFI